MKVILHKDVDHLGTRGDVVDVKSGYGRNFLIPQGFARMATPGAIRAQKEEDRQMARKRMERQEEAEEVKKQIEAMVLEIPMRVGEENRIFGTVTNQQVTVEMGKRGFTIDRRAVEVPDDIRTTGVYHATIGLHPEVEAKLKIEVIPISEV